ncbi:MAG: preprotein translocase subunit SecG [Bacteroidales bacterium]
MYLLISVLIIIVSVLMVLIVLVQNSKGGGLASNFASSNQVMGVRKTADFLEKATWTLAVALLILSLLASMTIPRGSVEEQSRLEDQIEDVQDPSQMPNFPTSMPEEGEGEGGEGEEQQPQLPVE